MSQATATRTSAAAAITTAAAVPTPSSTTVGPKVKKKRIRLKTERRREQCRRNQARYRNKQKLSALQLESTVEQLRHEVEQLQQHHESLSRTPTGRFNAEDVVHKLFHLFQFGLNVGRDDTLRSAAPPRPLPPLELQVGFVTSAFHPDLRVGDMRSCTYFLEQARRFSMHFDGLDLALERTTVFSNSDDCESIHTTFRVNLTITMNTLRFVFPHLVRAEHHHLRWKLLGQRLRCGGFSELVVGEHGRVAETNWTIDFITALQTVLTIEETAVVLQDARIERDAYLMVAGDDASAPSTPARATVSLNRSQLWEERHEAVREYAWQEDSGSSAQDDNESVMV